MKMYIAVLDDFPDYMTPTLVGHAVLGYRLDCLDESRDDDWKENYLKWEKYSFKKVVLRVNQEEFDKIWELPNVGLYHENNTLSGKKSCAVIVVNDDIPNVLKFAKLWKPKENATNKT